MRKGTQRVSPSLPLTRLGSRSYAIKIHGKITNRSNLRILMEYIENLDAHLRETKNEYIYWREPAVQCGGSYPYVQVDFSVASLKGGK